MLFLRPAGERENRLDVVGLPSGKRCHYQLSPNTPVSGKRCHYQLSPNTPVSGKRCHYQLSPNSPAYLRVLGNGVMNALGCHNSSHTYDTLARTSCNTHNINNTYNLKCFTHSSYNMYKSNNNNSNNNNRS